MEQNRITDLIHRDFKPPFPYFLFPYSNLIDFNCKDCACMHGPFFFFCVQPVTIGSRNRYGIVTIASHFAAYFAKSAPSAVRFLSMRRLKR